MCLDVFGLIFKVSRSSCHQVCSTLSSTIRSWHIIRIYLYNKLKMTKCVLVLHEKVTFITFSFRLIATVRFKLLAQCISESSSGP